MYRILTYDTTSEAYHLLKEALQAKGIKPYNSEYRYVPGDIIINWGIYGERSFPIHINKQEGVKICTSKLASFKAFRENGVACPGDTRDSQVAEEWLAGNNIVYARSDDNGCRGKGIQVLHKGDSVAEATAKGAFFFTKGFPTHREFRVYVCNRRAICVYEKKDLMERNLDEHVRAGNDWMYCRNNIEHYHRDIILDSIKATIACGLDFSGVDVGLSDSDRTCVFEVNSAPWLGTYTARVLAQAIKEITI